MVFSCRNSGLSIPAWCREHQIHPDTYYYRERQVLSQMSAVSGGPEFVAVQPEVTTAAQPCSGTGELTVELGAARVIVPSGVDQQTLAAVLQVLKSLC